VADGLHNVQTSPEEIARMVDGMRTAFAEAERYVVGRRHELELVEIAMVCRGHVLFSGEPGVAKSMVADLAFKTVFGARRFYAQLMAGTQPEELFGPIDTKLFREKAQWSYNTEGMLPEAHFALLDEVYRAGDSLLPSMLGVLNERLFKNGIATVRCPLITALGTTNFTTDRPELEAFHDRWLFRAKVNCASSKAMRLALVNCHLENPDIEGLKFENRLSLTDLLKLQRAAAEVELPEDLLNVVMEAVDAARASDSQFWVSDRRLCQAARTMQATLLLDGKVAEPDEDCLRRVADVFTPPPTGSGSFAAAAMTALAERFSRYAVETKETGDAKTVEDFVSSLISEYDPALPKRRREALRDRVNKALTHFGAPGMRENFTLRSTAERLEKQLQNLHSLHMSLDAGLNPPGKAEPASGPLYDESPDAPEKSGEPDPETMFESDETEEEDVKL